MGFPSASTFREAEAAGGWPPQTRIVVLVSGRGTNLQALIDSGCPVAEVVSDRPGVPALARAEAAGIPAHCLDRRAGASRAGFEEALAKRIDRGPGAGRADLVVLAGFLHVLGPGFTARFAGRIINVHPSLLPAFPGLHTHERALAACVSEHGCTVHFVTETLDAGPVIAQARVPVLPGDTPDTLAARVLAEEHRLLPRVVHRFVTGRIELRGTEVRIGGRRIRPDGSRHPPPSGGRFPLSNASRGRRPPAAQR